MPKFCVGGCVAAVFLLHAPHAFGQVDIGAGLRVAAPAGSLKELRDRNVVKQRYDFSCGAAALATILSYGFGDEVTEVQLLEELFGLLAEEEKESVRSGGFSLLHLQRVARARGYAAEGFRLTPEQLTLVSGPVIVYIEPRGYRHFAVLRGVRGDRVYLADPSRGNIRLPLYRFLDHWLQDEGTGIVFAVEPATGALIESSSLLLGSGGSRQPEVMSALEMLAVGSVVGRLPAFPAEPHVN